MATLSIDNPTMPSFPGKWDLDPRYPEKAAKFFALVAAFPEYLKKDRNIHPVQCHPRGEVALTIADALYQAAEMWIDPKVSRETKLHVRKAIPMLLDATKEPRIPTRDTLASTQELDVYTMDRTMEALHIALSADKVHGLHASWFLRSCGCPVKRPGTHAGLDLDLLDYKELGSQPLQKLTGKIAEAGNKVYADYPPSLKKAIETVASELPSITSAVDLKKWNHYVDPSQEELGKQVFDALKLLFVESRKTHHDSVFNALSVPAQKMLAPVIAEVDREFSASSENEAARQFQAATTGKGATPSRSTASHSGVFHYVSTAAHHVGEWIQHPHLPHFSRGGGSNSRNQGGR